MVEKVNFDDYAKNYDEILKEQLNFFSEDDKYFAKYKVDLVKKNVSNNPKRILEYGCGTGRNIAYFREHFPDAEIFGVDLSAESIEIASRENPSARFFVLDDIFLNTNASFDLIFVAGVFHHIA
ncbi:class I SAM-dependent methyltransferase, partial [Flavobacterium sp.]|uniref:class I SAM-dependent methyltransferase n=1 Tax=Flavobacterium sp. TaxID=239 RepID=UPI0037C0A5E2